MAKKRYDDGGEISAEDALAQSGSPENDSNAGMKEAAETAEAPKKETFKEAFAAARAAGKKTFKWDGKPGITFTTEMAGEKKATPKAEAPKAEPKKELKYQSLQDRARSYEAERAKSGVGMYGTKKAEPTEPKKTPGRGVIDTKNINPKTLLPNKGMKEGGGVKGWGMARGARKAKNY